jgi:hypothetical protein
MTRLFADSPCPPSAPHLEIPVKVTPTNWADVADAIQRVWNPVLMKGPISNGAVAVLLAQWDLETAEGRSTPNYNLAGIKCIKPDAQRHQFFTTKESPDGGFTLLTVKGKQAANCFRAWLTLDEGVQGWLETIAGGYGETLPILLAGNGSGWARAIGPTARPGRSWYTGPETNPQGGGYVQVVSALTHRYKAKLATQLRPPHVLVETVR